MIKSLSNRIKNVNNFELIIKKMDKSAQKAMT